MRVFLCLKPLWIVPGAKCDRVDGAWVESWEAQLVRLASDPI